MPRQSQAAASTLSSALSSALSPTRSPSPSPASRTRRRPTRRTRRSRRSARRPKARRSSLLRREGLRECFEEHAGWILDTAHRIGRKCGMAEPDARDFASWASLCLIRRDFAKLRACREPENLRGYLATVLRNLAKDYRNHLWGKWRPTVAAKELGRYGVELERLCVRDGFSIREAVEYLSRNRPHGPDADELEAMADRMPMRPRRTLVPFDAKSHCLAPAQEPSALPDTADFESRPAQVRVRAGLAAALAALEERDRELLGLIFDDGRTVASIARDLALDQKALYSRRDRCLKRLRRLLRERGLGWPEVAVALGAQAG